MKKLRLGTLFSGIGAIEQALKQLEIPFDVIFASDIDKFVKESYFANYNPQFWNDDINKFDGKKYKNKIDLLVGGSPCQSFSLLGNRLGTDDHRGMLLFEFIRVLREIRPKTFLFENVKSLTTYNKGKLWSEVLEIFQSIGYKLKYKVMNAKNYGVPQSRPRVYLVGTMYKKEINFPEEEILNKTMFDYLELTVNDKYYISNKGKKFVLNDKRMKKMFTQLNKPVALCQTKCQQYNLNGSFVSDEYMSKYILWPKTAKFVMSEGTKNFKVKPSINREIAHTLTATMHKMHRAAFDNYLTYKDDKIRKLTPRECLRLMGFSEDFKIVVSDTQMYRQAGNSIVVDVLKKILLSNIFIYKRFLNEKENLKQNDISDKTYESRV